MAENTLDTVASSRYVMTLAFSWGSDTSRLAVHTDSVTVDSLLYTAAPRIEVDFKAFDGSIKDAPIDITMWKGYAPANTMLTGDPHAPVSVVVGECDPADIAGTWRQVFRGFLMKSVSRSQGRSDLVRMTFASHKAKANIPLGIIATGSCAWTFGDANCQVDTDALKETGTVTSISGSTIIVSGITTSSAYWHRGWIERDGVRLLIRTHASGTTLDLIKAPPASWLNEEAELTPGCDKALETCREQWDNEERFAGIGLKMPSYNPLYESPE
jgi:hypothetical protein